jgi:hypothetical protein
MGNLGETPEDPKVLRDIAQRCRMIASAVAERDKRRILSYAQKLEKAAADLERVDAPKS